MERNGSAICPGSIVLSLRGRDGKRRFVITGIPEDGKEVGYVLIADGRLHRLDKPKRKNLRHLRVLVTGTEETARLLREGRITDSELAALLEQVAPDKHTSQPEGGDYSGKR
ncbi:MAG: KOW domain-containing RNA-binding protein [Clostridia bacterium]|nr:KOW domain-containing RNA-binding protein [Clostridia bacterium]